MNPKWKCCSMYSLGRRVIGNVLPGASRWKLLSICSFTYGSHPQSTSAATICRPGKRSNTPAKIRSSIRFGMSKMRPHPGSATRCAAGIVSVSDTWMLSGTLELLDAAEHLVVVGRGRQRAVRVAPHHEAAHPRTVDDAVDLGERARHAAVRDQREARRSARARARRTPTASRCTRAPSPRGSSASWLATMAWLSRGVGYSTSASTPSRSSSSRRAAGRTHRRGCPRTAPTRASARVRSPRTRSSRT